MEGVDQALGAVVSVAGISKRDSDALVLDDVSMDLPGGIVRAVTAS